MANFLLVKISTYTWYRLYIEVQVSMLFTQLKVEGLGTRLGKHHNVYYIIATRLSQGGHKVVTRGHKVVTRLSQGGHKVVPSRVVATL